MLRIRESRAFTMIELIVVVVILGILAGIAAVSYNAVIDRSKKKAVETAAQQLGTEAQSLAAYSAGQPTPETPASELTKSTDGGVTPDGAAVKDIPTNVTVNPGTAANTFTVEQNGYTACLTVGATFTDASSVAGAAANADFDASKC